jgi:hypothetical protein
MTPDLLSSVLGGHDEWLAEQVLHRHDLGPEQLEFALKNPNLLAQAAQHPALSEEQRNKLLDDPGLPEGLREVLEQKLAKTVGYIKFPKFGVSSVKNPAAYTPVNYKYRESYLGSRNGSSASRQYREDGRVPEKLRVARVLTNIHKPPKFVDNHIKSVLNVLGPISSGEYLRLKNKLASGKALAATDHHEVQHGIFGQLGETYGAPTREALTGFVLDAIPEHLRHSVDRSTNHLRKLYPNLSDSEWPEEQIAHMHNYLEDPAHRNAVHVKLGISRKPDSQRELHSNLKAAWQHMRSAAESISPEELGVKLVKSEEIIKKWVDSLQKNENLNIGDYFGHNQMWDSILDAIGFLTGQRPDDAIFRARLIDYDGDAMEAGLSAAGLGPEARADVESVLKMQALRKSEERHVELKEKATPLFTDAEEYANDINWASDHRDLEKIYLGGKHSKGMMIACNADGHYLLIKPGSAKQSPAAGASEEKASQSRREVAFYHAAKAMGLGSSLPRAELVQVEGKECAVMEMVGANWVGMHRLAEGKLADPRQILAPYAVSGMLHRWAVLDYVLGQTDRHGNNILVGPEPERRVVLIDHGSAFAGDSFDPAHDRNSFVPYYLRVWSPEKAWPRMAAPERLSYMPVLDNAKDEELRGWVESLNPETLEPIIASLGINPEPSMKRLSLVFDAVAASKSAYKAINGLWLL